MSDPKPGDVAVSPLDDELLPEDPGEEVLDLEGEV